MSPEVGELWAWTGHDPCVILVLSSVSNSERTVVKGLFIQGQEAEPDEELHWDSDNSPDWKRIG